MLHAVSKLGPITSLGVAIGLLLGACADESSSSSVTCGPGTVQMGDQCVRASDQVTCAEGATLTDGQCVPDVACGDNTSADASGTCVPDYARVDCSEGTTLEDDRCVADVECGQTTVARDGECVTEAAVLAAQADVVEDETAPNDPGFGGTPQGLTAPAPGQTLAVSGTLNTPADLNNDGRVDQDLDGYRFEASAGDYLGVETVDNGAGTLGFVVRGPRGYLRASPSYQVAGHRKVLVPYDGDYTVTVGPYADLLDGSTGARGDSDSGYVLTIENLGELDMSAAASADAAGGAGVSGRLAGLSDNLVAVDATVGAMVHLALPRLGADANAAAIVVDHDGQIVSSQPIDARGLVRFPESAEDLNVLLDYITLTGRRDAYTLKADTPSVRRIPESISATATVEYDTGGRTIPAGTSMFVSLDIELADDAGDPISSGILPTLASETSSPVSLDYRVWGPDGGRVAGFGELGGFYATTAGLYTVEITNAEPVRSAHIQAINVQSYMPADLGTFDASPASPGEQTLATIPLQEFRLVTFATTDPATATLETTQNGSNEALQLYLLGQDLTSIADSSGQNPAITSFPLLEPGRYFGLIQNSATTIESSDAHDIGVQLVTSAAPNIAAEPNDTPADATVIEAMDTPVWAELTGPPGRDVDTFVVPNDFDAPTLVDASIRLLAGTGAVVAELRDADGHAQAATTTGQLSAVLQPGESYYLHMSRSDGVDALSYLVETSALAETPGDLEAEPNDDQSAATPMGELADGSGVGAGGTLAADGDVDWYRFEQSQAGLVALRLGPIGDSPQPSDLTVELFQQDASGAMASVDTGPFSDLDSGSTYVKVSGGSASGASNTYAVRVYGVDAVDLGDISAGQVAAERGTFDGSGTTLVTFDLGQQLAADDSQTLFVWSSAGLEVLDSSMQSLYTASAPGAGLSATQMAPGTYYARLSGAAGEPWQLQAGILASTTEAEQSGGGSNDSDLMAQDIGMFGASNPLHVFGSVDAADANDWFSFEVSGPTAQQVVVAQMGLGATISDTDWELYKDLTVPPLAYGYGVPQVKQVLLDPGTYYVDVSHYDGGESGQYLLRVYSVP